ncbi:MAG: ADOP family duplicated permease, partial [Vicinamibacterales bacterium]
PLPLRLSAGLVSMNYFAVLGSAPIAGRTLQPNDIPADVAILSENLWRTRFGGSPSIIGQPIAIDGRRREVIGVMPRSFRGIGPPGFTREIWIPLDLTGAHRGLAINRTATRFEAYGRLEPGTSMDAARAAMRVVGIHMAAEHPVANRRFTAMEIFAVEGIGVYRGVAKTLLPVFAFVGFVTLISGFVLLVSCANLAGLLLARGGARRQEIAVCLALGAGRGRLMRQLLTESLLLAFAGGLAGLALATALTSGLSRLTGLLPVPVDLNLALDHRVLAYALAVSTATALLFGLAPARRASRVQLVHSLKVDGGGDRARQRLRKALIVAQVSVSALLIFWSGLFARSLLQANSVDPGFDPSGVLLAEVQLQDDAPGAAGRAQHAFVELHNRVRALASVEEAGWSSIVPLALLGNERFRASRTDAPQDVPGLWVVASRLSPGWFPTVRIPFAAGRDFTWLDREGSPMVVIVNETLARQLWNGAAVGQQLRFWSKTAEVVGVVRDSKYSTLGEAPAPTVYLPFPQAPVSQAPTLHVRTSDTRATAERIRQLVQELVPGATAGLKPMQDAVAMAMVPARVGAGVTGAFGLLGALLATMGIYGLISYLVVQRSREMAIRRAIGAPTSHIVRIAVGGVGTLAVAGLIAGLAAGALTAPLLSGLLVNVSPRDPFTLAATALVVLATTAMAGTPPALRATRIEPLTALKAQ